MFWQTDMSKRWNKSNKSALQSVIIFLAVQSRQGIAALNGSTAAALPAAGCSFGQRCLYCSWSSAGGAVGSILSVVILLERRNPK